MALLDSIKEGISRAIYKGVKHAGTAAAGVATSIALKHLGMELSVEQQTWVAVFVTGALGTGLKMLKDKFPKQLGWL